MLRHLKNRVIFQCVGSDFIGLMHSISTIDIMHIDIGHAKYGCILTRNSKFLADFWIYIFDKETVLIDIDKSMSTILLETIQKYKIGAQFIITKTELMSCYQLQEEHIDSKATFLDYRMPRHVRRYIVDDINIFDRGYDEEYLDLLIKSNIVDGVLLKYNKSFILEYGFLSFGAIDINKGCYIGQEVIARAITYGEMNKGLYAMTLATNDKDNLEESIHTDKNGNAFISGEQIGSIIKFTNDGQYGLALLKHAYISCKYIKDNDILWKIEPLYLS